MERAADHRAGTAVEVDLHREVVDTVPEPVDLRRDVNLDLRQ